MDFDLEAPGVHYKFSKVDLHNQKGIVDYIYEYVRTKERPRLLQDKVMTIFSPIKDSLPISLIPAGDVYSKNYWSSLSNIIWNDLLYKEDGILFLLDLKERIKNELNPDYLLIDSRTGITEIAGVTISLLADHVILLAANNPENLFGCRQIFNSIKDPAKNFLNRSIQISFVLTRVPVKDKNPDKDYAKYASILRKTAETVFGDANIFKDILMIHSDDELLLQESLKIGSFGRESIDQKIQRMNYSSISQDYLELFDIITENFLTESETKKKI